MIDIVSFTLNFRRVVLELIGWQKKSRQNSAAAETTYANQQAKKILRCSMMAYVFTGYQFWTVFFLFVLLLSGTSGEEKKAPATSRFALKVGMAHPKIENAGF